MRRKGKLSPPLQLEDIAALLLLLSSRSTPSRGKIMFRPTRVLTLLSLFLSVFAFAQANERVLYNAKIFTAESDYPYAEAVAIRGDKIVAVGNRAEVSKAVSSSAESVDLNGNFLTPGLIDSHCHAVDGGLSLISAD